MTSETGLLSEEEYYKILDHAKTLGTQLTVALIFDGVRVKELLDIKPEDIKIVDNNAVIIGQGNKLRYILLKNTNMPLDWPPRQTQRGIVDLLAEVTLEALLRRLTPHDIRKSGAFHRRHQPEELQAYRLGHKFQKISETKEEKA